MSVNINPVLIMDLKRSINLHIKKHRAYCILVRRHETIQKKEIRGSILYVKSRCARLRSYFSYIFDSYESWQIPCVLVSLI